MLFTLQSSIKSTLTSFLIVFALMLATAACDGPVGPQGDRGSQGPAGEDGTQGPQGPQGPAGDDGADGQDGQDGQDGEDGNANVTLYTFDGHDFSASSSWGHCFELENALELHSSAWIYYLVSSSGTFWSVPGYGPGNQSFYGTRYRWNAPGTGCDNATHWIDLEVGGGEDYSSISILQIEASEIVNNLTVGLRASGQELIPADLDVTDYDAVVEYYGITEDDVVRM